MTSADLLRRAADLVIEFGLGNADTTAEQVRRMVRDGDGVTVLWRIFESSPDAGEVELTVRRRTDRLEAFVAPEFGRLRADDAKRANLMYGRVVDLAARIEALR